MTRDLIELNRHFSWNIQMVRINELQNRKVTKIIPSHLEFCVCVRDTVIDKILSSVFIEIVTQILKRFNKLSN